LALETIQFPLELILELTEGLDLSICFDTGDVISRQPGPLDFGEALERRLPRLAETCLHDGGYRLRPGTVSSPGSAICPLGWEGSW
jgi:hypothetical protein